MTHADGKLATTALDDCIGVQVAPDGIAACHGATAAAADDCGCIVADQGEMAAVFADSAHGDMAGAVDGCGCIHGAPGAACQDGDANAAAGGSAIADHECVGVRINEC